MPTSVPPPGGPPSHPQHPPPPPHPGEPHAAPGMTMTAFMKLFTPEQRKKFMNILIQNLVTAIQKEGKKVVEALKKQREDIEKET